VAGVGGSGRRPSLVVVGAGIAGLAAAWEAADAGADVVLLDADRRAGGKLASAPFLGRRIDTGPDAFLVRRPEAVQLVRDVGMGGSLVAPATSSAFVWSGGSLQRLPEGLLLGLPTNLVALARSGVLSPLGVGRAALDLVLRGEPVPPGTDVAVGPLVRRRLGRQVHERLVDPLLGGINAGDSDHLSLLAGVPQLAAAVEGRRSLLIGAWKARRRQRSTGGAVFSTVEGGLGRFAEQLARKLGDRGVKVVLGFDAERIDRRGDGWSVVTGRGARFAGDAVVLAVPPGPAAALLEPHAATSAARLGEITSASVAMVCLAYRQEDVGRELDGSGFLVPRRENRLMTACSWASTKWPDLAPPGTVVVRLSAGRAGDARALALTDDVLVGRLHGELAAAIGLTGEPVASHVTRWIDGFPQYRPGHTDLVTAIEDGLPAGLEVAGAAYRGVGIPACIGTGRAAARRALATATSAGS
jgi:oxygen-dependent protoporphyrinogen oxidase